MKILNSIFLLIIICTALSCSDDSTKDQLSHGIAPVRQLKVQKTNREKEFLINFTRDNYIKDIQIEIAHRNISLGKTSEWTTIALDGDE